MRTIALCAVGLVSLLLGCATVAEAMRGDIDDGDYSDAIFDAEAFLKEEEQTHPDRPKVESLLEEAWFRQSRRTDTPEGYRDFLARYPQSKYAPEVRENLARTQFETYTSKANTLKGYQDFIAEFPDGQYAAKARDRSARLAWRAVDQLGTRQAYTLYRNEYGGHSEAKSAMAKEMTLAWMEAEKGGSAEDYLAFYRQYSDTSVGAAAYKIAHDLALAIARKADHFSKYRWFRLLFPDSAAVAETYPKEVRSAWQFAEARDDEKAYRWYLEEYPGTQEALVAEERAADLAYFNSPEGSENPRATVNQVTDRDPNLVWAYVDVKDQQGELVAGLLRDDFRFYENGRRAQIRDFLGMESPRPVDIVVVIDVSGSMQDKIESVKQSAVRLADILCRRNRDVRLGLVGYLEGVSGVFGDRAMTPDASVFQGWVSNLKILNGSRENPVRALWQASLFKFRKTAQKVVILLTDEAPDATWRVDPMSRLDVAGISRLLYDGDFTFYAVSPGVPDYRVIVAATRGTLFDMESIAKYGAFDNLMDHIATLLAKQYRIAYVSPRGLPTGANRKIRVRVNEQAYWYPAGKIAGNVVAMLAGASECQVAAVTGTAGIYVSDDCAKTWTATQWVAPAEPIVAAVGRWGPGNQAYVVTGSGQLLAIDGGDKKAIALAGAFAPVQSVWWNESIPGQLMVLSRSGALYLSTDAGKSFVEIGLAHSASGMEWAEAMGGTGGRICILDRQQGLVCREGDEAWTVVFAPGQFGPELLPGSRFASCPWAPQVMLLRSGTGLLYRSLDGGHHWSIVRFPAAENAPLVLGELVMRMDARTICQMTSQGVFCSTDSGQQWRLLAEGVTWGSNAADVRLFPFAGGGIALAGFADGSTYRKVGVVNREFVSSSVYFEVNSDRFKDALLPFLQEIGLTLRRDATLRAHIDGHADSDGPDDANMALSLRRAERVKAFLAQFGIAAERIETAGWGETRPLFPNTSEENKARNRRVEILLLREN